MVEKFFIFKVPLFSLRGDTRSALTLIWSILFMQAFLCYSVGTSRLLISRFLNRVIHSNFSKARTLKGKVFDLFNFALVDKSVKDSITKLLIRKTNSTAPNFFDSFLDSVDHHNSIAMNSLMNLYKESSKDGWIYIGERDGVIVEKKKLKAGDFVSPDDAAKGEKHVCVRSVGIINAKSDAVFKLFADNSRVSEYNEHCTSMKDIFLFPFRSLNTRSKITWASAPRYGPFFPRDFLSIVHYVRNANGEFVVLNRPAYHPRYLPTSRYVRATVLLAGNIIQPVDGGKKTRLTQIAHVNPGGGADNAAVAWVINSLCATGPPNFMRKLEKAVNKK